MPLGNSRPIVGEAAFVAPSASVIGRAELGAHASVWYGAVVRADEGLVSLGARSAVLDRAVISGAKAPASGTTAIGAGVVIGQGAVVAGAAVGDGSVVGAGAVIGAGAVVGKDAMVAAGASVAPAASVGDGELWAGAPAEKVRMLTAAEVSAMAQGVEDTVKLAAAHAEENGKTHEVIESEKLRRALLDERSDDYNSHIGKLGQEKEIVEVQARIIEENRKAFSNAYSS